MDFGTYLVNSSAGDITVEQQCQFESGDAEKLLSAIVRCLQGKYLGVSDMMRQIEWKLTKGKWHRSLLLHTNRPRNRARFLEL